MSVVVTTSRKVSGPEMAYLKMLPIQRRLQLDAPHGVKLQGSISFVELPESPTTILFQYSTGFADGAAFNEGVADIEGEIIALVKTMCEVETVYFATETIDFKQG
jgi:hypothetical protein